MFDLLDINGSQPSSSASCTLTLTLVNNMNIGETIMFQKNGTNIAFASPYRVTELQSYRKKRKDRRCGG